MERWNKIKLNDCVSLLGDGLHGTPVYDDAGEYYFINGNNLVDGHVQIKSDTKKVNFNEFCKFKKNLNCRTLFVSINGTIGNVAEYRNEPIILGKSACYLNVKESIDKDFIKYVLQTPTFKLYLHNYANGSTIKNVSLKQMREYEFLIPSFETQQKIANILISIDKKIELNNQINDNLLEQALTIYSNFTKEKNKNGFIGDYCSVKSGFAFKSSWWAQEGIKVIKIGSINQDNLDLNSCAFVEHDKYDKAKDFSVVAGDLLIAMTGATIGKFTMVPFNNEKLLVNQRVGKFFLGDTPLDKLPYIYCTLKQQDVFTEIVNRGQGSAQPNISGSDIMSIPCVILERKDLGNFNNICKPIFEAIIHNQYANEKLSQLRNVLLPKLMSGEIDVSNLNLDI